MDKFMDFLPLQFPDCHTCVYRVISFPALAFALITSRSKNKTAWNHIKG